MTVKATVTSTLNTQSAELVLIETPPRGEKTHERQTLTGGTQSLVFTQLDGGADKEYTAKIVPSTSDVTQTAEINYGAEIEIDPLPHRDSGTSGTIREDATFDNGVGGREVGLGDHALIGGLLTSALNDGEVLADDGYVYSTVQAAVDASSSWIFIGPGTFNEAVTINTAGLTVCGSGRNTLIDGGSTHAIGVGGIADVTIKNLSVQTTAGGGNNADGINLGDGTTSAYNNTVKNVVARDSDRDGIRILSESSSAINCVVESSDNAGIHAARIYNSVNGCRFESGVSGVAIAMGDDDGIAVNNTITATANDGVNTFNGNDHLIGGNRIHGVGDNGIRIASGIDNIIFNNRVSGSTNGDISDAGTGTMLDANLTGVAN